MRKLAILALVTALAVALITPLTATDFFIAACTVNSRQAQFTVNTYQNTTGVLTVTAGTASRLPGNNLRAGVYRFPVTFNANGQAGIRYRLSDGTEYALTVSRWDYGCGSVIVTPRPTRQPVWLSIGTR